MEWTTLKEQFEKVQSIVLGEVNVKEVEYISDTEGIITKKIKPVFKSLGKKYGKQMKEIASKFATLTQKEISEIEKQDSYVLALESGDVVLENGDYEISSEDMPGWLVASEGPLTLALDIQISDELKNEGVARELVNRIQNIRKESGYDVTDRVKVVIEDKPEVVKALSGNLKDYVCAQTLATQIDVSNRDSEQLKDASVVEWEGSTIAISVTK